MKPSSIVFKKFPLFSCGYNGQRTMYQKIGHDDFVVVNATMTFKQNGGNSLVYNSKSPIYEYLKKNGENFNEIEFMKKFPFFFQRPNNEIYNTRVGGVVRYG